MEQTQTQAYLGVLGDKRPARLHAEGYVSKEKLAGQPGTKLRQAALCQREKLGENFPPNYFNISRLFEQNRPKHALDGIFHKGYIYA
jgi:hypothetical protein